jgi:hypothetical protein
MTSTGDATGVVSYAPQPDQTEFSAMNINTTTQLSPQAQAVLDAYWKSPWDPSLQHEDRYAIAAVLRAVVQELKYFGITEKNILAIAAELENQ